MNRRLFIATLASLSLLNEGTGFAISNPRFADNPFTLGVASGDPDASSVVLWTKLALRPLDPDGGMPAADIDVTWEISASDSFTTILKSGKSRASRLLGHSVHVEVDGLSPDTWYWYRFQAGDATSPIGRTRTLPVDNAQKSSFNFAVASCQHLEYGYFTAYKQLAADDNDIVFHLGDYIYEYAAGENRPRRHSNAKLFNVSDYRIRYNQYRMDPLLQAAHARCPWFVTWDDHEVENNYAGDISERKGIETPEFLIHRANAYQAYYEMMPLRRTSIPRGPDMQLYRKAKFGNLAELLVLDTRQYRADQPNGDGLSPINDATLSPKQSMLGATQREWLERGLRASTGTWNVLAQQVMMGMVDRSMGPEQKYSMDQWPGYAGERMALAKFIQDNRIRNTVVLTGDIHTNWVNDLRVDDRKPELPVVATEFVGTSISSGGDGVDKPKILDDLLRENPFVKFHNQQRGYVRCRVTPTQWTSDFMVVDQVAKEGGVVTKRASFIVDAGKAGARAV